MHYLRDLRTGKAGWYPEMYVGKPGFVEVDPDAEPVTCCGLGHDTMKPLRSSSERH